MIENPVYSDNIVRGSDLQPIIDQLNAQEVFTDNMTILAERSTSGINLSVIDQYGGGGGGEVSTGSTVQIKITSGSNGIYTGNIIDPATGDEGAEATVFANRATVDDLNVGKYIVGARVSAPTLGAN